MLNRKKAKKTAALVSFILCIVLVAGVIQGYAGTTNNGIDTMDNFDSEVVTTDSGIDQSEEDTSDQVPKDEDDSVNNSKDKDVVPQPSKKEKAKSNSIKPQSGTVSPASIDFAGIDLSGSNDEFSTTLLNAIGTSNLLRVSGYFSATPSEKKLEITIISGMAIDSATGMVAKSTSKNDWEFDKSSLPGYLQGVITGADYTPGPVVNGYQVRSGKLTYYFNNTTDEYPIEVYITGDNPFLGNNGTLSFTNPISVTSYENGQIADSEKLEKYTVNGSSKIGFNGNPSKGNTNVGKGEDYKVSQYLIATTSDNSKSFNPLLHKGFSFQVHMPKEAGMKDLTFNNINENHYTTSLDTSDSTNDVLTVTGSPLASIKGYDYFTINGKTDAAAQSTERLVPVIKNIDFTYISGEAVLNATAGSCHGITIKDFENQLTFSALSNNYIGESIINSPADLDVLGGFAMQNPNSSLITGKAIQFEFDHDKIGVKAVRLMTGQDGAKKIVVKTSKNNTKSYPTLSENLVAGNRAWYANLNLLDELADDEYITSVKYMPGDLPGNAHTQPSGLGKPHDTGIYYYGKMLKATSNYEGKATTYSQTKDNPDISSSSDWSVDNTYTQTINLQSIQNVPVSSYYAGTGSFSKDKILAGDNAGVNINGTIELFSHRYNGNQIEAHKGLVVYLRQDPDTIIDPNSISVSYGGKTYKNYTTFEDNTDATVYKIELNDDVIGRFNKVLKSYSGVKVQAKIIAQKTSPTKQIKTEDIIFAHLKGVESNNAYVYGTENATIEKDKYNLTGNTNSNLMVPGKKVYTTIEAQPDFTVTTSADRGDDNWKAYEEGIDSTVVNLNTKLDARYKVDLVNNSGQVVDNGYVAIIPIPKKGETTNDSTIQTTPFAWSLNMKEDLSSNLSNDYNVKYATSYVTNKDSSEWKNWSEVSAAKESIKAVKVAYTKDIQDKVSDSFNFPLDVPKGDEAIAAKGKINLYSALIYANVKGAGAYRPSAPVALKLSTGIVSGNVMMDEDRSGNINAGDTSFGGITINAYKAGGRTSEDLMESTYSKNDGTYQFSALDSEQPVDIVFDSPGSGTNPMRFITPAADDSSHSKATVLNITPSGINSEIDVLLQKPYTVSFNMDGGMPSADDQKVYVNEYAAKPSVDPEKFGHDFEGWFKDQNKTVQHTFNNMGITSDTTIYAKFTPSTVKVDYDLNYDNTGLYKDFTNSPSALKGTYNQKLTAPTPDPSRDGYTFKGWFKTTEGAASLDNATKWNYGSERVSSTNDIKLYAGWTINKYDIVFKAENNGELNSDGDKVITIGSVNYGTSWSEATTSKIPEPVGDNGYYFKGWTPQLPGNTDKVKTNLVFKAEFEAKKNITFAAIDGGSVIYDGKEHSTETAVTISGNLISGHTYKDNLKAQAKGTDAKTYKNTVKEATAVNFDGLNGKNPQYYYNINYVTNDFVIEKREITVKPVEESRAYNGSVLKASKVQLVGNTKLGSGDGFDYSKSIFSGEIKNVGTKTSSITKLVITGGSPTKDNTGNYDVTLQTGNLSITNATGLSVSANNNNVTYDGNQHGIGNVKGYVKNKADNSVSIMYSDTKNGVYEKTTPKYSEAGTYKVFIKATRDNYNESDPVSATIKINKRDITVKPADVSKTYTGKTVEPSKSVDIVKGNLVKGQKIDLSNAVFSGARTEVGQNNITVKNVNISGNNTDNYDISYKTGTMTIQNDNSGGGGGSTGGGSTTTTPNNDPIDNDSRGPSTQRTESTSNVEPIRKDENTNNQTQTYTTSKDKLLDIAEQEGIPTFGIGDNKVPLLGTNAFSSWSLTNVLLVAIAIILAIIALAKTMRERESIMIKPLWIIIAVAAAVVNFIIVMVSGDFSGLMTVFDGFTSITIVLLSIEIFSISKIFKSMRSIVDDEF